MNLFYPSTATPHLLPCSSVFSFPFYEVHRSHTVRRPKLFLRLNCVSMRAELNINSINSGGKNDNFSKTDVFLEDCEECVDVIVLGSRKDALLEFCSASPFLSTTLRFWYVPGHDSEELKLLERFAKQDGPPKPVQGLSAHQSSFNAAILVGSAAYGSDHITALDVLSDVSSANGFVVGIILNPFRFEGKRRQDEVKDLYAKIQKHANICIVLDTDALLENDMLTLDEALKASNNGVLMAANAVSILISGNHIKLLNRKHQSTREIQLPEFKQIFGTCKESRIAFGAGNNVKASLQQAVKKCPFLGVDIKDLDGVIFCVFASSDTMDCNDTNTIVHTVRAVTGWKSEIIVSVVHEPNMEPKTILSTLIIFGYAIRQLAPNNGMFTSLGQHFPFIFNMFKKQQQPISFEETSNSKSVSNVINSPPIDEMPDVNSEDGPTDELGIYSGKPQFDHTEDFFSLSNFSGETENGFPEMDSNYSSHYFSNEGPLVFKRELFSRGNFGSGRPSDFSNSDVSVVTMIASVSVYKLPVGVKHLEKMGDTLPANTKQGTEWREEGNEKRHFHSGKDAAFNTKVQFNKNICEPSKKNYDNGLKGQGGLSARAASMLESERDSHKKWSRVVKMNYRGGIYRGQIQGGLPEGKGRLLLGDGSVYDGMWRYGKRSGLGTFHFYNGDVFQGSWRDDVMHGKGWYYFHTGDRWFVNFWKGKANGEGRFYSKLGEVFFGHFKDGLRHGNFLRINVNGTRCKEVWDEGTLVCEKPLDLDAEVG